MAGYGVMKITLTEVETDYLKTCDMHCAELPHDHTNTFASNTFYPIVVFNKTSGSDNRGSLT